MLNKINFLFIALIFISSVFAEENPSITNFTVHEKEKLVDIKFIFSASYNAQPTQKKTKILLASTIDLIFENLKISDSLLAKTKNINSAYISQIDISEIEPTKARVTLTIPNDDIELKMAFNPDRTQLVLRLENGAKQPDKTKTNEENENSSNLLNLQQNNFLDLLTPQYLITIGVLFLLMIVLLIVRKKLIRKKLERESLLNESVSDFEERNLGFDENINQKLNQPQQQIRKVKRKPEEQKPNQEKEKLTEDILKQAFQNKKPEEQTPVQSQKKSFQSVYESKELESLKRENLNKESQMIQQQSALFEELIDRMETLNRTIMLQEEKISELSSSQNNQNFATLNSFENYKSLVEPSDNMNLIFQDVDDILGIVTMVQVKNRRYLVLQNEQGNLLLDRFAVSNSTAKNSNFNSDSQNQIKKSSATKSETFTNDEVHITNNDIKALFEDSPDFLK
jgi:hypothetical protein